MKKFKALLNMREKPWESYKTAKTQLSHLLQQPQVTMKSSHLKIQEIIRTHNLVLSPRLFQIQAAAKEACRMNKM
jgi:hypothetical protein